jgi:hypothetical protein
LVVLVGLLANSLLGWWWMDPLAGLGVATLAIRDGLTTWRSGDLCEAGLPHAEAARGGPRRPEAAEPLPGAVSSPRPW